MPHTGFIVGGTLLSVVNMAAYAWANDAIPFFHDDLKWRKGVIGMSILVFGFTVTAYIWAGSEIPGQDDEHALTFMTLILAYWIIQLFLAGCHIKRKGSSGQRDWLWRVGEALLCLLAIVPAVLAMGVLMRVDTTGGDGIIEALYAIAVGWAIAVDAGILGSISLDNDDNNGLEHRVTRIHYLCAVFHVTSAAAILAVGYTEANGNLSLYQYPVRKKLWYIERFEYVCYNATQMRVDPNQTLCDEESRFYERPAADESSYFQVNVILIAFMFAFWSGFLHAVAATRLVDIKKQHYIRFIDYGVSAAIMLMLVNVLWGAANYTGVIISPIFLCLALIGALLLIEYRDPLGGWRNWLFGILVIVFILTMIPLLYSAVKITNPTNATTDDAAPKLVIPIAFAFVFLFSLFIVPYMYQIWDSCCDTACCTWPNRIGPDGDSESVFVFLLYTFLSLITKTLLHAALLIVIVGQMKFLEQSRLEPPSMYDQAQTLGGVAGAVIIVGIVGYWYAYRYLTK